MPSSGSGTMIILGPGVPPNTIPGPLPGSCISLVRYAQRIHQNECAFWGVANPADNEIGYGCDTIWSQWQREDISYYLAEAQQEIEQQIGYPICPRWFEDERQNYKCQVQADWGHIVEPGVMTIDDVALAEAVGYETGPAVIGPIATSLTETDEIAVFYPSSDRQIIPETIEISGGNLTIWIPRCRLVAADKLTNPSTGWNYDDLDNFTGTVDIKRVYNDPSVNATLVWPHGCTGCSTCSETTQSACMYVRHAEAGIVDLSPATYSDGWTRAKPACCCRDPEIVRLNYKAGGPFTYQMEDTIIRLAHSKMPDEMCGCETFTRLWRRDREIPQILTRERLNCPFGINTGAWVAWRFTQSMKLYRGSTF